MNERKGFERRRFSVVCGLLLLAASRVRAVGQPAPATVAAFNSYVTTVEARLNERHRSRAGFLADAVPGSERGRRLLAGETLVEQVTPPGGDELPGALLHHWRGTAFARGAKTAEFERLLKNFNAYPQRFAPEVLQARVLGGAGDRLEASLRVRQKHVLTVVMDSDYAVEFGRLDAADGYSASRSTHIYEIAGAGTASERALGAGEEHGFLWRQNTYWSYEERHGGLLIQIESVSLSRAIPSGLGWALRPYVESVPRESLEFTLRSACRAVGR